MGYRRATGHVALTLRTKGRTQLQQKELVHAAWSLLIAHCQRGQSSIQPELFLQAFSTCWKALGDSSLAECVSLLLLL